MNTIPRDKPVPKGKKVSFAKMPGGTFLGVNYNKAGANLRVQDDPVGTRAFEKRSKTGGIICRFWVVVRKQIEAPCDRCDGTGTVSRWNVELARQTEASCPKCDGSGWLHL